MADGASAILHDIGSSPWHAAANGATQFAGYTGVEDGAGSQFSNSSTGVGLQDDTVTIASPITVEAWFWQLRTRSSAEATMVEIGDPTRRWAIYREGNGTVAGYVSGVIPNPVSPTLAVRTWHQVAIVYDEAHAFLYANGSQIASIANTGHVSTACQIHFGETAAAGSLLDGFLGDVAIFATALSASRIAAHFNAVTSPPTPVASGNAGSAFAPSGGFQTVGAELDAILHAVQKTY